MNIRSCRTIEVKTVNWERGEEMRNHTHCRCISLMVVAMTMITMMMILTSGDYRCLIASIGIYTVQYARSLNFLLQLLNEVSARGAITILDTLPFLFRFHFSSAEADLSEYQSSSELIWWMITLFLSDDFLLAVARKL